MEYWPRDVCEADSWWQLGSAWQKSMVQNSLLARQKCVWKEKRKAALLFRGWRWCGWNFKFSWGFVVSMLLWIHPSVDERENLHESKSLTLQSCAFNADFSVTTVTDFLLIRSPMRLHYIHHFLTTFHGLIYIATKISLSCIVFSREFLLRLLGSCSTPADGPSRTSGTCTRVINMHLNVSVY